MDRAGRINLLRAAGGTAATICTCPNRPCKCTQWMGRFQRALGGRGGAIEIMQHPLRSVHAAFTYLAPLYSLMPVLLHAFAWLVNVACYVCMASPEPLHLCMGRACLCQMLCLHSIPSVSLDGPWPHAKLSGAMGWTPLL